MMSWTNWVLSKLLTRVLAHKIMRKKIMNCLRNFFMVLLSKPLLIKFKAWRWSIALTIAGLNLRRLNFNHIYAKVSGSSKTLQLHIASKIYLMEGPAQGQSIHFNKHKKKTQAGFEPMTFLFSDLQFLFCLKVIYQSWPHADSKGVKAYSPYLRL